MYMFFDNVYIFSFLKEIIVDMDMLETKWYVGVLHF